MGWLISLITGPLFSKVIGGLTDAYKVKLENATKRDKLAVDLAVEEIRGEVAARQVEAGIIREEQGWWVTAMIRPLMALPFIMFTFKIVLWDKVVGSFVGCSGRTPPGTCQTFNTDPMDPNMWSVFITVVGAYFGGRTIEKVARIFKR